jgi:transcriptional regulator with PAS, ATPase and Fis domain
MATTIQVDVKVRKKLQAMGRKGETYNDIIKKLIRASGYDQFIDEQSHIRETEMNWVRLEKGNSAVNWTTEFPSAITVCDSKGIIIEMNDRSAKTFEKDGGLKLVGKSVLDCHPPKARGRLNGLLKTGKSNTYTIEKKGKRKLIHQSPWFKNGKLAGLVELSIELPEKMPHFVRK